MGISSILQNWKNGFGPRKPKKIIENPLTPKWHSQLVLVCEKCGKKLAPEGKVSLEFKEGIKKKMIPAGLWGPVRFVTSSCLDLCPEGKVAVAFTGDSGQPSEVIAIDPASDRDFIFNKIAERVKNQAP